MRAVQNGVAILFAVAVVYATVAGLILLTNRLIGSLT